MSYCKKCKKDVSAKNEKVKGLFYKGICSECGRAVKRFRFSASNDYIISATGWKRKTPKIKIQKAERKILIKQKHLDRKEAV